MYVYLATLRRPKTKQAHPKTSTHWHFEGTHRLSRRQNFSVLTPSTGGSTTIWSLFFLFAMAPSTALTLEGMQIQILDRSRA